MPAYPGCPGKEAVKRVSVTIIDLLSGVVIYKVVIYCSDAPLSVSLHYLVKYLAVLFPPANGPFLRFPVYTIDVENVRCNFDFKVGPVVSPGRTQWGCDGIYTPKIAKIGLDNSLLILAIIRPIVFPCIKYCDIADDFRFMLCRPSNLSNGRSLRL